MALSSASASVRSTSGELLAANLGTKRHMGEYLDASGEMEVESERKKERMAGWPSSTSDGAEQGGLGLLGRNGEWQGSRPPSGAEMWW